MRLAFPSRQIAKRRVATQLAFGVFTLLGLAMQSNAATIYVSPTGNNSNSGTSIGSPRSTLVSAIEVARPGDTIKMLGGTYYYGRQDFVGGGTSTAPITMEPYNSTPVLIDGQYSGYMNEMLFIRAPYLTFKGITITNVNGNGVSVWKTHDVIVDGLTIQNCQGGAISAAGDVSVGTNVPTTTPPTFQTSNVTIRNCTMRWNAKNNIARTANGGWPMIVNATQAKNVTISGCRVYENYGEGIGSHLADSVHIVNNVVYDNFSVGIYIDNTRNSTIERNFVTTNFNTEFYRFGTPSIGIGTANEYYNFTYPIYNNKYVNNIVYSGRAAFYYGNYWGGGGLANQIIANNTFVSSCSDSTIATISIDWDTHSNTRFVNNIVYNASSPNLAYHPAGSGINSSNNSWYSPYAGWLANGLWGAADIYTNPQLVSLSGSSANNCKIANTSPAKTVGASGLVTNDYFGVARTNPVSIGAHENNS